jgi:DNA-binding SARP family transcriptional activator
MEFRILGPLDVVDDGRAVEIGGSRPRALLAILLLRRNETVPAERLREDLYGPEQPATGAKSVQAHISRLRKALGAHRLRTSGGGYALVTDPDEVDADRCARNLADARAALAAGDAASAERSLMEALALWRGPPLADFAYQDFARAEIARLDELRLACVEELFESRLALGRHAESVGELEVLVSEHPLRERLRAQLMLALYRDGRQAEALAAYRTGRRALVDELGIEPTRALRELQQAILRQDPALEVPAAEEPRGTSRGTLVGRARELGGLVSDLEDAFAGGGRLVFVAGEPGIGKSRLAEELSAHARSRDALVLVGRCWEAGGAPAYWPWVQSLRVYARSVDPVELRERLGVGASDLVPLLPELRSLFPDLEEPDAPDSEGARFRLFEAVAGLLKSVARDRPVVLILDDLHASDASSLLMLRFVVREIREGRVLILCLFRDVDPTLRDPLVAALADVLREPHARQVALQGLTVEDVARYIELTAETPPEPELAARIHAETEGNPLFLGEVVRLLDAELRLGGAGARASIPPGVRAVIGQRVRRLSEPCRALLAPAAVLGREFGIDALARLGGLPRGEVLRVLDEAMLERVVGEAPLSPGRLRFGHALIRDTLYDELTLAQRLDWHLRAGEALEAVYASDREPHLAELALHFHAAVPAGGVAKAVDYARRAGDRAVGQLAYEEAVRLFDMALTLVEDEAGRVELLLLLGDAQARAGDTPASKQTFRAAAELADRHGLSEALARAALGYGGRITWSVSRDDESLALLLERALAGLDVTDTPLRARLLARLAGGPLRDSTFAPERRRRLSAEALEMARRIGEPSTLAYALAGYISSSHSPEFTPEQVTRATELVAVAIEAGELELAVEGYEHRAEARLELGDMTGAKADLEEMAKLAARLRQPSQDWFVTELRAHQALLEGRLVEAERLIAEALDLGQKAESWSAAVSFGLQMYMLRSHQGRIAEIEHDVRRSVTDYPTYPIWRCVLTNMTAKLGGGSEASELLDGLADDGFSAIPFNEMWMGSMNFLAEAAALLDHRAGADALYALLLPYADRVAVATPEMSAGAVARALGLLAATLGRLDEAEGHFDHAIALNDGIGARPWSAYAREDYARVLLDGGGAARATRAEELLLQAERTFRELGMDGDAVRAAQRIATRG